MKININSDEQQQQKEIYFITVFFGRIYRNEKTSTNKYKEMLFQKSMYMCKALFSALLVLHKHIYKSIHEIKSICVLEDDKKKLRKTNECELFLLLLVGI